MIVILPTHDDFLSELELESEHVVRKIVRVQQVPYFRTPELEEAGLQSWAVTLTTAIRTDVDAYIAECHVDCGLDDPELHEDTGNANGHEKANEVVKRTRHFCESLNLSVRGGKIELL